MIQKVACLSCRIYKVAEYLQIEHGLRLLQFDDDKEKEACKKGQQEKYDERGRPSLKLPKMQEQEKTEEKEGQHGSSEEVDTDLS